MTDALVRRLLAAQMPHLADRSISMVEPWGTDNGIGRLGDDLVVRPPRIGWAEGQVAREATWLPRLAPHLPVAVPEPAAVGAPVDDCPYRWGVHRWIPGHGADLSTIDDPARWPSSSRTSSRRSSACRRRVPRRPAIELGRGFGGLGRGLVAAPHDGPPVWVHADLEGDCLVQDGRLGGVVDWGSSCAGDPTVDVPVVWSPLFTEESRTAFLSS